LAGLEKINSGLIELNGNVLNHKNTFVNPDKRKIGFVFQDYPLFPHLNILENISINLEKKFLSKIDYILNLTNLKDLCNRYPHQLSGGEQQRACLARALVREPDLLLLDEPFSNLDSNIKLTIQEEIHKIIKETKTTTILVTHDIRDTFNISDKILIFKAGILQQYDSPVSMYCNPINCYCAKILGDLNQVTIDNKTFYLRPEKIKLSKNSKFDGIVEKSQFAGKEYKISVSINGETWAFFNDFPLEKKEKIKLEFENKDLIEFDSTCSNFFTSN
jgi:ABC-type Fe3+/spermidine/putrescine transport system ATPase subunit